MEKFSIKEAYISDSTTLKVSTSGRIHKPKDIILPHQNLPIHHIGIDIGGSLAKVTYYTKNPNTKGGTLKFFKIETEKIDEFVNYLRKLIVKIELENQIISESDNSFNYYVTNFENHSINLYGTGGGSIKFASKLRQALQLNQNEAPILKARDEMESLIIGLNFLINNVPNEVFIYDDNRDLKIEDERKLRYFNFNHQQESHYPYLLVNIGSGVSMIKVTGPKSYMRIGGSSIGGGTLWGILSLLTNAKTYDDMLSMASNGDNANVDMLVGDIYGESYNKIGLKSTTIASSFGKVFKTVTGKSSGGYDQNDESVYGSENESGSKTQETGTYLKHSLEDSVSSLSSSESQEDSKNPIAVDSDANIYPSLSQFQRLSKFRQTDISKSFLYAVSNNIGQIAYLQAEKNNIKKIFFAGSFIRNHLQTIITLSYAINFWSNGSKKAYFLQHEGYLGSIGAFFSAYQGEKLYDEYLGHEEVH